MSLSDEPRFHPNRLDAADPRARSSARPAWRRPVRESSCSPCCLGSILHAALQGPPRPPVVRDRA